MVKREEVLAALSRNGGNRSRAALELGITRRHLIRLLKPDSTWLTIAPGQSRGRSGTYRSIL